MMNTASGRHMAYKQHIHQSIENILFTRLGTRVQREEYGSLLPDLIDMPLTPNIARLRLMPPIAPQPLPGLRLLQGMLVS